LPAQEGTPQGKDKGEVEVALSVTEEERKLRAKEPEEKKRRSRIPTAITRLKSTDESRHRRP
jgi:hypothetical protein